MSLRVLPLKDEAIRFTSPLHFVVTSVEPGRTLQGEPLNPPLLARQGEGEGEKKKEGLAPLLNKTNSLTL